jgi:hypothetical protein
MQADSSDAQQACRRQALLGHLLILHDYATGAIILLTFGPGSWNRGQEYFV